MEAGEIAHELAKLVKELADDLEAEIVGRFGDPADLHPAMRRRYDRDIGPVVQAKKRLRELGYDLPPKVEMIKPSKPWTSGVL